MGGLVGGIFDLAGGDPTAHEEQGLQSLSGYENNLGEQSTSQGLGFESDILSGDPTKIAQALAPEIKAGQDQVQQQFRIKPDYHRDHDQDDCPNFFRK